MKHVADYREREEEKKEDEDEWKWIECSVSLGSLELCLNVAQPDDPFLWVQSVATKNFISHWTGDLDEPNESLLSGKEYRMKWTSLLLLSKLGLSAEEEEEKERE